MTDLNDLVDSKARMDITAAHAINGAGWIACQGTDEDGDVVGILPRPVESPPGDVNCDGSVYLDDLGILIDAWGACSPLES